MKRAVLLFMLCTIPLAAEEVDVDITACRAMYDVMKAMREGRPRAAIAAKLDAILATRPYRVMFAHYNRSWRPNHLLPDVFKRMILSLAFPDAYEPGENERADRMRVHWAKYYADLPAYEKKLRQLETVQLPKLIADGVQYAQSWLPPEWKIPPFYFPILPQGGSPAFSIDGSQGYDFLQLPEDERGAIDLQWLTSTVAHESHHLGMQTSTPESLTPAETIAFQVLTITLAEGSATKFISGTPPGCAPPIRTKYSTAYTPEMRASWNERMKELAEILIHQTTMLDRALADELTEEQIKADLSTYWLNGSVGRAYVLGSEMLATIYLAFGKEAVFAIMKDPRTLFERYNAALDAKPEINCPHAPTRAVHQALGIGKRAALDY